MSWLFGRRTNVTNAADKINAFQSTTCDFGTPLPIVFGTARRSPNLINYQDFDAEEIKTRVKTGKRSSSTQIDYKYYVYVELALCEGDIAGIGRLWVNDKAYASLSAFNASEDNQGAPLSLNTGDIASPTTYMTEHHPDIAVGYVQMAYLYGYIYLGTNSASIPSYNVEVRGLLRSANDGGDGTDANPAEVIRYLINLAGYGNYIHWSSWYEYKNYCEQADLFVSTPQEAFTSQKKTNETIKELLVLTNTYMFWSVDGFKFVPRDTMARGTWEPHTIDRGGERSSEVVRTIYDLTPDEMAPQEAGACVIYEIKDSSEVYNRFGVMFTDRANNYENETVYYEDTDDISANGIKSAPDVNGKWLHTLSRAVTVAEMQARINRTETVRYKFKLSWAYAWIEPGDVLTLTDPVVGLDMQLVMVESVTENPDFTISVTALRREMAASATLEIGEQTYNIVTNNKQPGNVAAPLIFVPPAELTTSANIEIWMAIRGTTKHWGGCYVYGSTKDGDYELAGRHNRSSYYGTLLTALTASGTTVDVQFGNIETVGIPSGSADDSANGLTDVYIDGEVVSYTSASLIGTNQYRLSGLTRGKYRTTASAHSSGANFAMLDGNLFTLQLPKNMSGKTLYLKFPSFNRVGSVTQDVANVDYYTFSLVGLSSVTTSTQNYSSAASFPANGDPAAFYVDTVANKLYRWDNTTGLYYCIGSDYTDITEIDGGGAQRV